LSFLAFWENEQQSGTGRAKQSRTALGDELPS